MPLVEERIDSLKLEKHVCFCVAGLEANIKKKSIDFEKTVLCFANDEQPCLSANLHHLQGFTLLLF